MPCQPTPASILEEHQTSAKIHTQVDCRLAVLGRENPEAVLAHLQNISVAAGGRPGEKHCGLGTDHVRPGTESIKTGLQKLASCL